MDAEKHTHPVGMAFRRYADAMRAHASIPMPAESKQAADVAVAQTLLVELAKCMDEARGENERTAIWAVIRYWNRKLKAGLRHPLAGRKVAKDPAQS